MRRTFRTVAPDLRLAWLLPGAGLALGVVGIAMAAREQPAAWWMTLVLVACVALIAGSLARRRVTLDGDRLIIAAGLNGTRVAVADLDLAAARIVDLKAEPALRPGHKTFGTQMPGYHAGHFRLRNRGRGFVLVTDTRKVLVLPERGGRTLLLSLQRPQALLDALADVASRGRGR